MAILFWGVMLAGVLPALSQSALIDFDTGSPALAVNKGLPLDQTAGGVTAHFSASSGNFTVQTAYFTGYPVSSFTNQFLYPAGALGSVLEIRFSEMVTNISFSFATIQVSQNVDLETPIYLQAFTNSPSNPPVGSASATGLYGGGPDPTDPWPQGKLSFSSPTPFNLVRISVPNVVPAPATGQAYDFLLDNIRVGRAGGASCTITAGVAPASGGSVLGTGAYSVGISSSLLATPNLGYQFANWTENGVALSSANPYAFTATTNRTLTANFVVSNLTVKVGCSPFAGGSVNLSSLASYPAGTNLTAVATPKPGYGFVSWLQGAALASATNVVGTSPTYTFTVTSNSTLLATFLPLETVSLSVSSEGGVVSGGGVYLYGSPVKAMAIPALGYGFLGWRQGGVLVTNAAIYRFPASASVSLVASFAPVQMVLPAASPLVFGQSFSSSVLSGGLVTNNAGTIVTGKFVFSDPLGVPYAGTTNVAIRFIPSDPDSYNLADTTVDVSVDKQTPVVLSGPQDLGLTYGERFGSVALTGGSAVNSAGAIVDGTFAFADPSGVPNAGTTNTPVRFTPSDTANYTAAMAAVTVSVAKQTPVVSVPPQSSDLVYGQSLSQALLSGGAVTNAAGESVPGGFAFVDPAWVPWAGVTNGVVRFDATDFSNYNSATTAVNVVVVRQIPVVASAPKSSGLTYGQNLSAALLSGGAATNALGENVAGSFSFLDPTLIPAAGTTNVQAVFTPTELANYKTASVTVAVTVDKQTPTVSAAPSVTDLTYGQCFGSVSLSGGLATNAFGAGVAGTFAFADPAGVPNAGTTNAAVTFTPADEGNYKTATAFSTVLVLRQTPVLSTAPMAQGLVYGQNFGAGLLSGGSVTNSSGVSLAGSFVFTDSSIVPDGGLTNASVIFTPADAGNYNPVTCVVSMVVGKQTPVVWLAPRASGLTYGQSFSSSLLGTGSATNAAGAGVQGTFEFTDPAVVPNAGLAIASVIFTPTITNNYTTSTITVNVDVARQIPSVSDLPAVSLLGYGQSFGSAVLSGGGVTNAAGTTLPGAFAFPDPAAQPNAGITNVLLSFQPEDALNYDNLSVRVSVDVAPAPLTIEANPANKVYGETIAFEGTEFTALGLIGSDSVSHVTLSSEGAVSRAPVGQYAVSAGAAQGSGLANYSTTYIPATLQVEPALITVASGLIPESKFYDGTSNATIQSNAVVLAGLLDADTNSVFLSTNGYRASFDGVGASTTAVVSVTGLSITGDQSTNYTLLQPLDLSGASILPQSVAVAKAPSASGLAYGQSLAASVLSGGSVTNLSGKIVGGRFAFATPQALPAAGIINVPFVFTPDDSTDYLSVNGTVPLAVAQAPLIITALSMDKSYGQNLSLPVRAFTAAGLMPGDTVTNVVLLSPGTTNSAPVGSYALVPGQAAGVGVENYLISYLSGTLTVHRALVSVSAGLSAETKLYDGTISATIQSNSVVLEGLFEPDNNQVFLSTNGYSATFDQPGAGSNDWVTVTNLSLTGYLATNYTLVQPLRLSGAAILPQPLGVSSAPAVSGITYGETFGTSIFTGGSVTNQAGQLISGNFGFVSPETMPRAGIASAAVVFIATDSVNYQPLFFEVPLAVTRRPLSIQALNVSKIYGQTAIFSATGFTAEGLVSGDTVTKIDLSSPGDVKQAPAGRYSLFPSGAQGVGLDNYLISYYPATLAVTPAALTLEAGLSVDEKVYDGTSAATLQTNGVIFSGLLDGDANGVFLSTNAYLAHFDGVDASTNHSVTVTNLSLCGDLSSNYVLIQPVTIVGATISPQTAALAVLPSATALAYGQSLANAALTGGMATNRQGAVVTGRLSFVSPDTIPDVGLTGVDVLFAPEDTLNYSNLTFKIEVTVGRANPVMAELPAPTPITYGKSLSDSMLSGGWMTNSANGVKVDGTFAFAFPASFPQAPEATASVIFSPTDSIHYESVEMSVVVPIARQTPTIVRIPTASALTYGQAFLDSILAGGEVTNTSGLAVPGDFVFVTPREIPDAGETNAPVAFIPADTTNYGPTATVVRVVVNAALPGLAALPLAGPISYGQKLADSTLTGGGFTNAASALVIPGIFEFTEPNLKPAAGVTNVEVVFTPTDRLHYASVKLGVEVQVGRRPLFITALSTNKVYGRAIHFSGTEYVASGLTNGDLLSSVSIQSRGSDAIAPVGKYEILVSDAQGAGLDNYSVHYQSASLTVSRAPVAITDVAAANKAYDGTPVAALNGGVLSGVLQGDALTFTPGTGIFDGPNVGNRAVVASGYGLGPGGRSTNYYLVSQPVVANATITPRLVTITNVFAADKVYDGTDSAALSGGVISGAIPGDGVSFVPGSGVFSSADAGSWPVTPVAYRLGESDVATNYLLAAQPLIQNGLIHPAPVAVIAGLTAQSKVYDASTRATIQSNGVVLSGVLGSDTPFVRLATNGYSAQFERANAGTNLIVTVSNLSLTGDRSGNYALVQPVPLVGYEISRQVPLLAALPGVSALIYGQSLGLAAFSDGVVTNSSGEPLQGTFSFVNPGQQPHVGTTNVPVVFTPADIVNYSPIAFAADISVNKASASLTFGNLEQVFNGIPLPVVAATIPAGLTVDLTYNGGTAAPLAAGNYIVAGTVVDPNYTGSMTATLRVAKAPATVSLGGLNQTYNASGISVTAATVPSGLAVDVNYNGSASPPTNRGDYAVTATISDSNYQGSASATLVIGKAFASVALSGLSAIYSGLPQSPAVSTVPEGLIAELTYNGSLGAPVCAGVYAVAANIHDANYQGATNATFVIQPAAAVVALTNLLQTYDGTPRLAAALTDPTNLAVQLTYNGSTNPPVAAGSYDVVAGVSDTNYQAFTTNTLVVIPAPITIQADNLTRAYGDDNPSLTAQVSGRPAHGDDISYMLNVAANSLSDVGIYPVVVSCGTNANYAITTAPGTLSVTPRAASVSAVAVNRPYGMLNPVFNAVVSGQPVNGAPLSYTLTTTATAFSPVGSYPLNVIPGSNPNYSFTSQGALLTVEPQPVTVTAQAGSKTYGDPNPSLTSVVSGVPPGGDPVVFTLSTTATNLSSVGAYPITVLPGVNSNYAVTPVQAVMTVIPHSASVVAVNTNRAYSTSNPQFSAVVNGQVPSGTVITYTLASSAASNSSVGVYPISITLGNNPNYSISATNGSLTVDPQIVAVTVNNTNKAYGDPLPVFTSSGVMPVTNLTYTLATTATPLSGAGIYPIYVVPVLTNSSYSLTGSVGTLTVTPKAASVAAVNTSRAYGAANPTFTATVVGLVPGGDTLNYALATAADSNSVVGVYPITVTLGSNPNYSPAISNGLLTVSKAAATISITNLAQTYDGAAKPALAVTVPVNLACVLTYSGSGSAPTNAGSYSVVATVNDTNYVAVVTNTLVIARAPAFVVANNQSRLFGTTNPVLTAVVTGQVPGGSVVSYTLSTTALTNSAAGVYPITVTLGSNTNYLVSATNGTLSIVSSLPVAVTLSNLVQTYSATARAVTVITSPTNVAVALSYNGLTAAPTNAGSYTVVGKVTNTNYFGGATNILVVNPASASIVGTNLTRAYGATNPVLRATVKGQITGGSAIIYTLTTTAATNSPVGIYDITVVPGANTNYSISITNGLLTVSPKAAGLTGGKFTRAYGATNPIFTATAIGLVNGDTLNYTFATTATPTSGVGTNVITVVPGVNTNYTIATTNGSLVITKAPLIITADNKQKVAGAVNPVFSASYAGFVNSDTAAVLTSPVAFNTTAATNSAPGAYPITPTNGVAANYSITNKAGSLNILRSALWFQNVVATGALNSFDADTNRTGTEFALLFEQDAQVTNTYQLAAANPGQLYYLAGYSDTPGTSVTATLSIPLPLMLSGIKPVSVYGGYDALFTRVTATATNSVVTLGGDITTGFSVGAPTTASNLTTFTLAGVVPTNGVLAIVVHLDYAWKGTNGWAMNATTKAATGTTSTLSAGLSIPSYKSYTNGIYWNGEKAMQSRYLSPVQSTNVVYANPGFIGQVNYSTLFESAPRPGLGVSLYNASTNLIGTATTDANGAFKLSYTHPAAAADYYIDVLGVRQKITVSAGRLGFVQFTVD